jgi:iduronate 2-sulfatase
MTLRITFLLITLFVGGSFITSPQEKAPKNVLFIVVDDLNTMLGCYNDPNALTPNIDKLAARGVRFDRSYCQYPLCNPSRASFLSGKRPENLGIYNLTNSARKALPEGVFLPQFFRQKGFFTAGAGKIFHSKGMNDDQSWDFYEDGNSKDPEDLAALTHRAAGNGVPSCHILNSDGSQTRDGLNNQTILNFMAAKKKENKPFFLALGYHKPHLPWAAPKRFFDAYPLEKLKIAAEPVLKDIPKIAMQTELSGFNQPHSRVEALQGYLACISFIDYQIGLILEQLDKLQLWENTVVVLVGDNGFHLGDHEGLWAKLSAFDNATRVPLIFAGRDIPQGRVVKSPVELIDIYPTLIEVCGFDKKEGLDGVSLVKTFKNSSNLPRKYAQSMVYHFDTTTRKDVLSRTVIASNWRYTTWNNGTYPSEFYFNKEKPSAEYQNQINNPKMKKWIKQGEDIIQKMPPMKTGSANRPRALLRDKEASKELK